MPAPTSCQPCQAAVSSPTLRLWASTCSSWSRCWHEAGPVRAVGALAVLGIQLRGQRGHARAPGGIARRGGGDVQAQLHEGAGGRRGELLAIEAVRLLHRRGQGGEVAVVGVRVQQLRVGVDVGQLRPGGGGLLQLPAPAAARSRARRRPRRSRARPRLPARQPRPPARSAGSLQAPGTASRQRRRCGTLQHGHPPQGPYLTPAMSRRVQGVRASITTPTITPYQNTRRNSAGSDSRWLES